MSRIRSAVFAAVLGGVVAACSSDSTGNGLPNVVGAWTITKFEFTSIANPATKTDLKAAGGTGTITFNSNSTWAVAFTLPGQGVFNSNGTYTETAATLTITVTSDTPPEIITFDMVVSGSTLSLTGGTADFDFGTGDVPAHLTIIATK
jgi:hypothetical protein